jgi:hypothetical protein
MKEYFIVASSFAAPFFSDQSSQYIKGENPTEAMKSFVKQYKHPAGLYSAALYASADAYHKNDKHLLQYLSNHELGLRKATRGKHSYSYYGRAPGDFEINGQNVIVSNPKGGRIIRRKAK